MIKNIIFILTTLTMLLFTNVAISQTVSNNYILSTFNTSYGDFGRYHGRAHNIRQAASVISNVVLVPGEEFSFNERVGERTAENNYRPAPVIGSGRIRTGLGGGVCQLASTIYAAALYSGMEIIEHHQHSRVSSYIRPGLDATVDWGTKDLIFKNPYSFSVTMNIEIKPGRRNAEEIISVVFTAPNNGYEVNVYFSRHVLAEYTTVEIPSARIPSGQRLIIEHGTPGIIVNIQRSMINASNGNRDTERESMVYPPSRRIIMVSLQ